MSFANRFSRNWARNQFSLKYAREKCVASTGFTRLNVIVKFIRWACVRHNNGRNDCSNFSSWFEVQVAQCTLLLSSAPMHSGDEHYKFVYGDGSLRRRNFLAVHSVWLAEYANCSVNCHEFRLQPNSNENWVRSPIAIFNRKLELIILETGQVIIIIHSIRGRDRISSIKLLINRFLARSSNKKTCMWRNIWM